MHNLMTIEVAENCFFFTLGNSTNEYSNISVRLINSSRLKSNIWKVDSLSPVVQINLQSIIGRVVQQPSAARSASSLAGKSKLFND